MPKSIRVPNKNWQELDGVQEPFSIRRFQGVSTMNPMAMEPGYAADLNNVSSLSYPSLSVRPGISTVTSVGHPVRFSTVAGRMGVLLEATVKNLLSYVDSVAETGSNWQTASFPFGSSGSYSAIATATSPVLFGSYSLRIPSGVYFAVLQNKIQLTVSPNEPLTFSVYVTQVGTSGVYVYPAIQFIKGTQIIKTVVGEQKAPTSNWQRYVVTTYSDEELIATYGNTFRIDLFVVKTSNSGDVYFDGAQFEHNAYATPFSPGGTYVIREALCLTNNGLLQASQGSIELAVVPTQSIPTQNRYILDCGGSTNSNLSIYIGTDGKLRVEYGTGTGTITLVSTSILNTGLPYDIAVRWSAQGVDLFVNGVLEAGSATPPAFSFGPNIFLGTDKNGTLPLGGLLDYVRISSVRRNNADIAYTASSGPTMDSYTTALFHFDTSFEGVTPNGTVYANIVFINEMGSQPDIYPADETRFTGLGVLKDDTFLAITAGRARSVKPDGSVGEPLISGLPSSSVWSFTNFQGNFTNMNIVAADGNTTFAFDGNVVTLLSTAPSGLKYVTSYANRVYGAVGDTLHYSALRKADDWQTANDAGSIRIETEEGDEITGLKPSNDFLMIFKRYSMFELRGTGPSSFRLIQVSDNIGCVSHNSIVAIGGALYWLGSDSIYRYSGGAAPESDFALAVKGYVDRITKGHEHRACAATDGRRYYVALPIDGSQDPNILLEYDPTFQVWTVWTPPSEVRALAVRRGTVYAALKNGNLVKFDQTAATDDGQPISWSWESPPLGSGTYITRKRWYDMWVVVDLSAGSTLNVYLSPKPEGNDSWTLIKTVSAQTDMQSLRIILPVNLIAFANWVRVRLEGTGPAKVHELAYRERILPL